MPSPASRLRYTLISCLSGRQTVRILPSVLHKWDVAERSERHIYTNCPQLSLAMSTVWHGGENIGGEGRAVTKALRRKDWQQWKYKTKKQQGEQRQRQREGQDWRIKRNKSAQKRVGGNQSVLLVTPCIWITNCTGCKYDRWLCETRGTLGREYRKITTKR